MRFHSKCVLTFVPFYNLTRINESNVYLAKFKSVTNIIQLTTNRQTFNNSQTIHHKHPQPLITITSSSNWFSFTRRDSHTPAATLLTTEARR